LKVFITRLDYCLRAITKAGDRVKSNQRLARIGPKATGCIGDIRVGSQIYHPAADPLQPLLQGREVLNGMRLAIGNDNVSFALDNRLDQISYALAGILIVAVGIDQDVRAELESLQDPVMERLSQSHVAGVVDEVVDAQLAGDLDGTVGRTVIDNQILDRIDTR